MTLQEFCDTLPESKQVELALSLIKHVLPVWDDYAKHNSLSYRDTVVGLTHTVPKQLLADTTNEVEIYFSGPRLLRRLKRKNKLLKLYSYFSDPVIALWDSDWELPQAVEKTFYSVYHLTGSIVGKKKTVFDESAIYVSINQAIDAIQLSGLLSEKQIREIIYQPKNNS
jgi:hypothetical protein